MKTMILKFQILQNLVKQLKRLFLLQKEIKFLFLQENMGHLILKIILFLKDKVKLLN